MNTRILCSLGLAAALFGTGVATADYGYDPGTEGCTPGYWKQPHHLDSWAATGYSPDELYSDVFSLPPSDLTLLDALRQKGGGWSALYRHSVAALLNAAHFGVDYPYLVDDVKSLVSEAAGDPDAVEPNKDELADANELGCPLN